MDREDKGLVVLVVDDSADARELAKVELEQRGYRVETAENGTEALEKYRRRIPACVVLDLAMPGKGGIEIMNEMLMIDRGVPMVISSAYDKDRENFRTWVADAYVIKGKDNYGALGNAVDKVIKLKLSQSRQSSASAPASQP